MRLVLSLLALCLTWNSFGSAADPVVCVPISAAQGPANSAGITPINCQIVANKTIIACYPTYQVNFPQQFPTRVSCTPMEPTTTTSTTTSTTTTTVTSTTVTPSTTEESSFDFVLCLPIRSCGCGSNSQGVDVIICFLVDIEIEIRCYPRFIDFIFGQNTPIECLPLDEITTTESTTTEEPTTTELAETEEAVICVPYAPIEDAESNENGVKPIYCMLISNHTIIICCPLEEFIFFPGPISQRIMCVPVPQPALETTTTEVSTATSSDDVLCIPLSPCDGSSEESNEEGVKAIYCIIIDIDIIVKCYPKVIDFIWNQTSPIHCEKIEEVTLPSDSSSEEEETIDCIPFRPCEGSSEESNEDGVNAIFCLIEIDVIVKCFPKFPMGWAFNQTATIECVPVKEVTVSPPTESGESGEEETVICVPMSPCEGSSEETNENGVEAIYCIIIDIDIIVKCFPKMGGFIFNQTRIECVLPPKEITATPPTDSGEDEEIVDCIPFSPCEGSSEESNEDGVKAIYCIIIDVIVKCYPKAEHFEFNQTTTIECVKVEEVTVSPSPSGSSEEEEPVICIPFKPCEGSSEETNENGIDAIYCLVIDIDVIVKCFPKEISFAFNQTASIECIPVKEVTVSPPTPSGSSEEEEPVICIPFSPCQGSSEETSDDGIDAIYCLVIDIDIVVKCFPKVISFAFNQTASIECIPVKEVTVSPPTPSGSSEEEEPVICIPFSPCQGSSEESNEQGVDAIYCLIIDIDIIVKCFPKEISFAFNQTASIECIPVKEVTVSPPTPSGSSEEEEPVICIPFSPCQGSSEESNEQGVDAIYCLIIDIDIIVKCFPKEINFSFNQTASIECVPVKEVTVSPPTDSGESEAIDCIPMSPCEGSSEESNEDGVKAIMCWLIDIEIVVKCFPLIEGWTFNQTATIKCLPVEETTITTEIEEESSTAVSIPPVVFCIPFSPCTCGHNDQGIDIIKCLIVDIDIIIMCYPKEINFAFNQTAAIECETVYENGSSEEQETTVAEIETSSTGIVVPEIVFCIPFSPCTCGHNDQSIDAIQCLWIDFELIVYCYPTNINFAFNQTAAIECATVSEEVALLPQPSTVAVPEVVACIPFSPCTCGANSDGIDAIQCLWLDFEMVVTCYPHVISFGWNQTATIDCTTVVV